MWEEVRRALGRLVSRTAVRELPAGRMTVSVALRGSDATDVPVIAAGAREELWRPRTETLLLAPPRAQEGGGGADLAAFTTVIGANAALQPSGCPVHAVSVAMDGGAVRSWEGPLAALGASRSAPVSPRAPRTQAVSLLSSRVDCRRLGSRLTLRGGRTVSALARLAEIPMTRQRLASEDGFAAERAHLAFVSGVPVEDVALVGVFLHVPLGAVGRLAVGDEGNCLRIWLKADALGPKRTPGPKLVTIVLGRQRSTGKTLQAVMAAQF